MCFKIGWTILIVTIYMLGRYLLIPTIPTNQEFLQKIGDINILNNLVSVTGAQYNRITFFSLGLSPWMTMMIIWRFFTVFGVFKNLTNRQVHFYRMLLVLLVAFIQSYALVSYIVFHDFQYFGNSSEVVARSITILILISGTYGLIWLGNVNSQKGIGGMTIIILVNMLLSFKDNIIRYVQRESVDYLQTAVIFSLSLIILVMITVIFYKAEYRIPIRRIGVNNTYSQASYLPIRLTPAGAMPFMYGMTMMMLPPYIISILLRFFPENAILSFLAVNIGISRIPGAVFYLILLYVLAIGFGYYNYDMYDIAKSMRNSGDYIENIRPGEKTRQFLHSKIKIWIHFGAFFVVIMGGIPLLVVVLQKQTSDHISIALLISNAYIIASLLLGIIEQFAMLMSWKKYKNVI